MKLLWKTEKLWLDGWIHFRRNFEGLKTEANFFFPFYSQNQFQQDQRGQEEDLENG